MSKRSLPGFTGAYQDGVTSGYGLGQGYRWHLPVLMRFNAPDSLSPFAAGGINPYAYCAGDPINHSDPTGHMFNPGEVVEAVDEVAREHASSLAVKEAQEGRSILKNPSSSLANSGRTGRKVRFPGIVLIRRRKYTATWRSSKLSVEKQGAQYARFERFANEPVTLEDHLSMAGIYLTQLESKLPVLSEHAPRAAVKYAGESNDFTKLKRWNELVRKAHTSQRDAAEELSTARDLLRQLPAADTGLPSMRLLQEECGALEPRLQIAERNLRGFKEISWNPAPVFEAPDFGDMTFPEGERDYGVDS